ncbi:MAG: outer membrane protein assembly factor BamB family protein [Planctomycetota bacterium]|jgi:outer membrane protein assembly factor BamB
MRYFFALLTLVALAGAAPAGETRHEWPMVGYDTGGTGISPDARVKPPFRLRWATQPGVTGKHDVIAAGGMVFTPNCGLDGETGKVIWKGQLRGCKTAPSYYKGRLYAMGKSSVIAYEAATGNLIWQKSGYAIPYFPSRVGLPVCDGAVYAGKFAEHEGKKHYFAAALDAKDGRELWSTPLLPISGSGRGGYELGDCIGTPAVAGGRVFFTTHSPKMVCALDQKTGKEIWRQEGILALSAVSSDGKIACAADHAQGVWVLDAATGKKISHWGGSELRREKANYLTVGTAKRPPVIVGKMLITSNYGRRYTALDAATGKLLWVAGGGKPRSHNMWAGGCGTPSAAGGHVYSAGLNGENYNGQRLRFGFYAVDQKNGKLAWKHIISGKSCGKVAVADGRVYSRAGTTEIVCFEPVPADWKAPEPQPAPAQPAAAPAAMAKPFGGKPGTAAAGGKPAGGADWPMYGGGPERCGLEMKIGLPVKYAWKFQTGGRVKSSPVIANGIAYAGSDSGTLFALQLATGAEKWKAKIGSRIRCAPAVAGGVVVCGADDGLLRAFDAETGKPKWEFKTGGPITASPAIVGERVVFGSWDGRCYCVRLSDGEEFWRHRVGDPGVRVNAPPAVANGRVYVGAWEDFAIPGLDLGTGKPLADYSDGTPGRGTKHAKLGLVQGLAVYRGLLVTRSHNGASLLDASTGKIITRAGWPADLPSLPAFSGDRAYCSGSPAPTRISEVLAKPTGARRSREAFNHPATNAVLVAGDLIVAATTGGTLEVRCLPDEKSTEPAKPVWEWKSESGAEISTAPAAAGGFIVAGSDDGHVYAFSYGRK